MHKIEKIIKMVKGKNCSNVHFIKEWQQLGVIVCFISVSRFQGFLNSENSLSITLALLKSMEYLLRQPCAAMFEPVLRIFTIWMCSFFLVSQHSSKDNRHKEFYTYHIFWNSIGGLDSGEGKSCCKVLWSLVTTLIPFFWRCVRGSVIIWIRKTLEFWFTANTNEADNNSKLLPKWYSILLDQCIFRFYHFL